ncbi:MULTISPECIES: amino acid adenylation domain-containing protein [unclassified Lysinibacillus]|uniref:amino acid adenylation domain-containing protein n=1 Tax=unclassified Lysinibacillus TaxID=2636778 RepID=UPI003806BB07
MKKLLEEYSELGVNLWVEDGKLHFKAPTGVLTNEHKERLKEYKKQLLDYLQKEQQSIIHDTEKRYDSFPLTDIQSAYLVGRSNNYRYGGVGCKVYAELVGTTFDPTRLEKAWHQVIKRHDMLRAIVHQEGYQQVLKNVELPTIQVIDLSDEVPEVANQRLLHVRNELSVKQYAPNKWPLYDLVLTQQKNQSVIHLSIDMLIADFVSINVLIAELEHYYYTEDTPLPALDIQFRDVMIQQYEQHDRSIANEKAKNYWTSRLETFPETPELPVQSDKIHSNTIRFEQFNFLLPNHKWQFLSQKAKDHRLTPSSIILTAFAEIIGLWSKQSHYCMNITMLNRPNIHAQIHDVIGDFTTINLLEIHAKRDRAFYEHAAEIQQQLWTDLEYRDFSGIEVLRELKRHRNRDVIIPVVYTSTLGADANSHMSENEPKLKLAYKISQTPQVWIDCQVSEQPDGILINWDVREGIFPSGLIDSAFQFFVDHLTKLATNETAWTERQLLGLPEAMQKIRNEVNKTTIDLPKGLLYDNVLDAIAQYAKNIAIYADGKYFTYEELGRYVYAIQQALINKGVRQGDFVAIDLQKGIWQIAAVIGTLTAGGVYLPLDIEQPIARKKNIISESQTTFILGHASHSDLYEQESLSFIEVEQLNTALEAQLTPVRVDVEQPAYIIHTSGSTGKAKGVIVSHRAVLNTIMDMNHRFQVTEHDRVLAIANLAFDLSVYDIFGLLSVGGSVILPEHKRLKDPKHWLELLTSHQATIWNSVPAQLQLLHAYMQDTTTTLHKKLRLVFLSGDWIPVTLPKQMAHYFEQAKFISLGGATEAAIWSIYYPIDINTTYKNSIPYGKPLANQYFYVLNKELESCPDWTIGDLYIGGEGLATGYLQNEKNTTAKFIVHPYTGERLYATGDIGRLLPDGVIEFLGREDTQVKINGHRIELSEIESSMQRMQQIEHAAVIASKDLASKEFNISAFVQARKNANQIKTLVSSERLTTVVKNAGDQATHNVDRELFAQWSTISNWTAVLDIMKTFQDLDIFIDDREFSISDIQQIVKVHPYYHQLLRRWLNVLCKENLIKQNPATSNYYLVNKDLPHNASEISWLKWRDIEEKMQYGKKLVDYFEDSSKHLLGLLRGDIDSLDLFFPKGRFDIALAAYKDNLISRSLNQVTIQAVHTIVDEFRKAYPEKTFRILEVGAGVGGVSLELIPTLNHKNVEYVFTDLSQFFLNEARKSFEPYKWVTYGLYDINQSYWSQGIQASSFDLILCNNVLHNAKKAPQVLQTFKEMTVEGGALIVADTTGENYSLLTSMEFHAGLNDFEDFRKNNDQVFFNREQWHELFAATEVEIAGVYPTKNDPLSAANQAVFVGQFIGERKRLYASEVQQHLERQLPKYMIPAHIEVLRELPLSENGKVDRGALQSRLEASNPFIAQSGESPQGDLEKRIAEIWAKALNRESIWRNENFYQAGGDSLLVAQVVAAMRDTLSEVAHWEWDQLMVEILQTPTIAEIAEKISHSLENHQTMQDETASDTKTSFVILAEGEVGGKIKVLFHDGTGTLTPYNQLLPYLIDEPNRKDTIAGFIFGDEADYLAYTSETLIQNLGQKYAQQLLKLNASNFELIGYCMGGLIAVETAKVLLAEGVQVEPVITIDTTPCDAKLRNDLLMERTFGLLIGADLVKSGHDVEDELLKKALHDLIKKEANTITIEDLCNLTGEFAPIAQCYQKLASKSPKQRLVDLYTTVPALQGDISAFQKQRMVTLYQIFCQSFKGVVSYGTEPFMGDVVAFSCIDKISSFLPVIGTRNEEFWRDITFGHLNIIPINGNHITCLQEPNVKETAQLLLKGVSHEPSI